MEKESDGFIEAMLNVVQTPQPFARMMEVLRNLGNLHKTRIKQYLVQHSIMEQYVLTDFFDDFQIIEKTAAQNSTANGGSMDPFITHDTIGWKGSYKKEWYGKSYRKEKISRKKLILEAINTFKKVEEFHQKQLENFIIQNGEAVHPQTDQPH